MTQSDLGLFSVGQLLRDARESQGLDIANISAILKIREDHLMALEEDDFDRLPGSVYAIGFIRTYSRHLGLNASDLIEQYKSNTIPVPKQEIEIDVGEEKQNIPDIVKIAVGAVVVLAIVIIWLFAGAPSDDDAGEQQVQTSVNEDAAVDAAAPVVAPPAPSPAPAAVPTLREVAEAVVEQPAPAPEANPVAAPAPVDVQPSAAAPEADSAQDTLTPDIVEIRSRRRTWMRVESEQGKVLFTSIIDTGRSFRLPAGDNFVLATRDAGALEYVVNGEAVGGVGRRGQILTNRKLNRAAIIARSE